MTITINDAKNVVAVGREDIVARRCAFVDKVRAGKFEYNTQFFRLKKVLIHVSVC